MDYRSAGRLAFRTQAVRELGISRRALIYELQAIELETPP
jgi:hypothetical protein